MKVNFIGGDDVQRSLNHSDNRCVNLIPSLNDKGDIAAFYKVDGLKSEGTLTGVPTGAYKASNGRAFYTSGTVLYELTVVAGVYTSTNRGTITTATTYRMSDNGIEMILVNGTDGWLFTFSTNALQKIKVATDTFTVTIADPAVFTQSAHGLVAGDAIRLTTTTDTVLSDSILSALSPASSSTGIGPGSIAVSPLNDFVYATAFSGIYMYSRNIISGLISPLSPPSLAYSGSAYANSVTLSSDGISLYVTNYNANVVDMFTVNIATGIVAAATPFTIATGTTPSRIILGPNATVADAFAYVVNSGANTVSQYSRNLGTGELTALTPASVAVGTLPQDIAIGTNAAGSVSFAYVTNKTDNTITVHVRNVTTGLLTATPTQTISCGGLSPIGIIVSPESGNAHVYVVNNGSNHVAMFSRDATTGLLTALSTATVSTGINSQRLIIAADGDSVYVSNTADDTVSMYSRDNSTGILYSTSTATIATGDAPIGLAVSPNGSSVYVTNNSSSSISQYSRNSTATTVGLPTGLSELTTYYVLAAGLTADAFTVSETAGGTAVSTSGQQAGIHTYTTLGYGFPEGAKTVSYMNGRFVALEPSTQNFYVSEVLNGKWWDALNVQTVDSNPDYVVGEIVSHNELIVFCDDSGEVFYDSGTYPTPFVRNSSGIFEVGCIAPYSICNLDNQVFWLGGNKAGKGIVYKLQGYTPIRISTHSIEYAIQSMSTTSDARAFAYQKDGHHYYVLTFPTGNKTFVYDVNTGLWHERAASNYTLSSTAPTMSWSVTANGITAFDVQGICWNGSIYVIVGDNGGAAVTKCYSSPDGITWTERVIPSGIWTEVAWNGTVFCAVCQGNVTTAATSPDGITWTSRTLPAASNWFSIDYGAGVFFACGYAGSSGTRYIATSPDGITWTARTDPGSEASTSQKVRFVNGKFIWFWPSSNNFATSTDGITWTLRTKAAALATLTQVAYGNDTYLAIPNSGLVSATSTDGINWTQRALPESASWRGVAFNGEVFCIVNNTNNNAYISEDGITWTQIAISGAFENKFCIATDGAKFVVPQDTTVANSSTPVVTAGSYTFSEWPVNEYMFFNNEHLVTDTTTTLLSIDSATYKNGNDYIRFARSFIVPTQNMNKTRHTRLQLDCEVGVGDVLEADPTVTLKWSDDAGNTYNTGIDRSIGVVGEYNKRVAWHRLGMTKGQPRVYDISGAPPTKVVLLNVHLD